MKKTDKFTKQPAELQDIFVSTVIVLRPELEGVEKYVKKLFELLNNSYTNFEIVIVDNGASDTELSAVTGLLASIPCIRLIRLSQQFKYDTAIFAGLDVSIGDYVCTLDPATDAIDEIPFFIKENQEHDVVQGESKVPIKSVFGTQIGRKVFYWYNRKYIGIDIPLNATYYASYSRRAINALTASSSRHSRHVRHMARRIGRSYVIHPYAPLKNPASERKLRTGIVDGLEIITSYSTHPLRFVTWLAVIAGGINVLYAFYVLILNLTRTDIAAGWTSTSMQLSLMFFILFMVLILLSEYIGRILTEIHREPSYYISDELTSTVAIADTNRKNVVR